jgi:carboxypeptidase Taq
VVTDNGDSAYARLTRTFRRLGALDDTLGILDWDQATVMPEGSAAARADQIAALSVLRHELLTDPAVSDALDAAESELAGDVSADGDWRRANLRGMRRDYLHATAVPAGLVEAKARADSACEIRWRSARRDNDFAGLVPTLDEVLRLVRETAAAKAAVLGLSPYDALLDGHEPGARSADVDALFDDLAAFLPDFLPRILAAQASRAVPRMPEGPFPVETQRALGVELMQAVGFDFSRGRLDVSHHPFCGGASGDVRITTRYDEADFTSSLMGVLHETGHAMYELGLPPNWRHQPVGRALGMAIHESQSLLVEMQVCRSREFLAYAAPRMRAAFGGADGEAWDAENLYRLYTRVEPGFIRVDADEVTYPAHVILRYRLERALVAGDLALADLPGAWADGMRELLGIVPPDDRLGCLQDIHWPSGAFGYFPTYTMGAVAAAQLYAAQEVLRRVTGEPLNPAVFRAHLEARYLN